MEPLYVVTDAQIREMIAEKFGGHGGGARLAKKLGISPATASVLRNGGGSLLKVADFFGYVPLEEQPGYWRQSAAPSKPEHAGYIRWTLSRLLEVRRRLHAGDAPTDIAKTFGLTARRMREVIKEHRLRDPEGMLSYDELISQAQAAGDPDLERKIRIEQTGHALGGSEQFASMSRDSMTDDQARKFDAELKVLLDARKK